MPPSLALVSLSSERRRSTNIATHRGAEAQPLRNGQICAGRRRARRGVESRCCSQRGRPRVGLGRGARRVELRQHQPHQVDNSARPAMSWLRFAEPRAWSTSGTVLKALRHVLLEGRQHLAHEDPDSIPDRFADGLRIAILVVGQPLAMLDSCGNRVGKRQDEPTLADDPALRPRERAACAGSSSRSVPPRRTAWKAASIAPRSQRHDVVLQQEP